MGYAKDQAIADMDKRRAARGRTKERKYGKEPKRFQGDARHIPAELFKWAALEVVNSGCLFSLGVTKNGSSLVITIIEDREPTTVYAESSTEAFETMLTYAGCGWEELVEKEKQCRVTRWVKGQVPGPEAAPGTHQRAVRPMGAPVEQPPF